MIGTAVVLPIFALITPLVFGPTLPYPVVYGVPEETMEFFAWKALTAVSVSIPKYVDRQESFDDEEALESAYVFTTESSVEVAEEEGESGVWRSTTKGLAGNGCSCLSDCWSEGAC